MRIAKAIVVTEMQCPFCKALLLVHTDADCKIHETLHEQPVCDRWVKFCRESGAKFMGERVIEPVRKDVN